MTGWEGAADNASRTLSERAGRTQGVPATLVAPQPRARV